MMEDFGKVLTSKHRRKIIEEFFFLVIEMMKWSVFVNFLMNYGRLFFIRD